MMRRAVPRCKPPPWRDRTGAAGPSAGRPERSPHILNTPNSVGAIGAFNVAASDSPSTRRVSAGSMTPSSHSRALA